MSGGSLEYASWKIDEISSKLRRRSDDPLHMAMAMHLDKLSKALHDIEWVLSGDYGPGREVESVMAVLGPSDLIESLEDDAKAALIRLQNGLGILEKMKARKENET